MDNDKGKGKAIASEDDGKSPQESVRELEVRASTGFVTREINIPYPRPTEYNFGVDPSLGWVMHGGRFMREANMPPLARNFVFGSGQNNNVRWVRVGFPTYHDISRIVPRAYFNHTGVGTSAQGAAMFRGSTTRNTYFLAPHPSIVGRPLGLIYFQPGIFLYGSPNFGPNHRNYLNNSGEGTSTQSGVMGNDVPNNRMIVPSSAPSTPLNPDALEWRAPSTPSLNPHALEWRPAPIEDRSLFITFSHGEEPLTSKQIFWFLAMTFGITRLLEVDINQPRQGPAQFGRLVFTTPAIPRMILNGQAEAQIVIYNRSVICKKYVPKDDRTTR